MTVHACAILAGTLDTGYLCHRSCMVESGFTIASLLVS